MKFLRLLVQPFFCGAEYSGDVLNICLAYVWNIGKRYAVN